MRADFCGGDGGVGHAAEHDGSGFELVVLGADELAELFAWIGVFHLGKHAPRVQGEHAVASLHYFVQEVACFGADSRKFFDESLLDEGAGVVEEASESVTSFF